MIVCDWCRKPLQLHKSAILYLKKEQDHQNLIYEQLCKECQGAVIDHIETLKEQIIHENQNPQPK